jgi:hypothetical protein
LIHHCLPEGGGSARFSVPGSEVFQFEGYTQCPVPYIKLPKFVAERSRIRVIFLAIAARLAQPLPGPRDKGSVMTGNIFNSKGIHVGMVDGLAIFDLAGRKLYNLKGTNIYRLSGELVGHLSAAQGTEKRLDRATDRLFPGNGTS